MKRGSKAAREPKPKALDHPAMPTAERDELWRQGAKAAARGDHSMSNPMSDIANMPDATGESLSTWEHRKQAWQHGHDSQSKIVQAKRSDVAAINGDKVGSTGQQAPPSVDDMKALIEDIRVARETLAALRSEIALARSDEAIRNRAELLKDNQRLQDELSAQQGSAALAADSALAALQDAVLASETDALTRLPNRSAFWDRLTHDLALAKRQGTALAVLFLDLDGLKQVNDRFGHDIGDLLLQHVASVLLAGIRASDTVCRMGGDEFVIVAAQALGTDWQQLARKIEVAVALPCRLGGHLITPGVSIGTAAYPDDSAQPQELVRMADAAMYRVKRTRR